MAVIDLANPTRFLTLVDRVLPWLAGASALVFAYGLYRVLGAPDDYQQGATVRIMFFLVPAAWMASFVYASAAWRASRMKPSQVDHLSHLPLDN